MPLFSLEFSEEDPLFCAAFHPEKPEFLLGFASGRVSCYRYTTTSDPEQVWTTKRHKGSCRAIRYSQSGEFAVSAGQDAVAKRFASATGKVTHKASLKAGATVLEVNEEYVVIGDEDGNVSAFTHELRPHREYAIADVDSITAICSLDSVNKHNFAVSGESRIVRIDVRKDEPVSSSEDQEDEILCGCIASEKWSAWGMSEGAITVWNNRGLADQQNRVVLAKDGSVESIISAEEENRVVAGTSDGLISEVDITSGKILVQARHNPEDANEEVAYLDYDCEWRLVTMSMRMLKVWPRGDLEAASRALKQEKLPKKKKRKTAKSAAPKPSGFEDLVGDD